MNILGDVLSRVNSLYPEDIENEEVNALWTTINNEGIEIEVLNKELEKLRGEKEKPAKKVEKPKKEKETKVAEKPATEKKAKPAAKKKTTVKSKE